MSVISKNMSELFSKIFEPYIRLLTLLFQPCIDCLQVFRQSSSFKSTNEQQYDNGDGFYHNQQKKSIQCI